MNICIDLGGTNLKAGLISGTEMLQQSSVPLEKGADFREVMNLISLEVNALLCHESTSKREPLALGLCMPGIIDTDRNRLISVNEKHSGGKNFNFNSWAKETFGLPLVMENDARAAMAGEWQVGNGVGYSDLVMLTLGTGIGTSAVIKGEILYGKHYQAGCLGGHFTLNHSGLRCNCGNVGCAESEASSWILRQHIQGMPGGNEFLENYGEHPGYDLLFRLANEGNSLAKGVIEQHMRVWSATAVTLIHAYDPDILLISGGVMNSRDVILPYLQDYVNRYAWTPEHQVKILASSQNNYIALWGMNYLINRKIKLSE